jgi:thymidylate kinase
MKSKFLIDLFLLLNADARYAVLRNYDTLPQKSGRDIDLIIQEEDFRKIEKKIVSIADKAGFRLLTLDERQYMCYMAFAAIDNGEVEIVSLDFLFHIHLRQWTLFSTEDILATRMNNGKVYHLRPDYQFITKYVYNRLCDEPLAEKYENLRRTALSDYKKEIEDALRISFGNEVSSYEVFESLRGAQLLSLLRQKRKKDSLMDYAQSQVQYFIHQSRRFLCTPGMSIGFTGPDGVGKTTVIDQISTYLTQTSSVTLFHHRPGLFGNLSNVAQKSGLTHKVDDDYSRPHRGKKTGSVSSLLRLLYYASDYILGYQLKVRMHLFSAGFVIFDRYYTDVICDARRSRIYLSPKFLYHFGKVFIPSLDYNILLTASTDTILGRKKELDKAGIEDINAKIDYLADKKDYYKVLNESTPQEAIIKILSIVFDEQHRKNLKRLR